MEAEDDGEWDNEHVVCDEVDKNRILLSIESSDWPEENALHVVENCDDDEQVKDFLGELVDWLGVGEHRQNLMSENI